MEGLFERIKKANETIITTDIKGKEYAEVNQRIKAFRMIYPQGTIETRMISNENGIVIFEARVYGEPKQTKNMLIDGQVVVDRWEKGQLLGTGTAYEKENSTFINKTSYIENCETSAVGRALGMAGFGIDTSVASAEEVQNAINNQVTINTEEEARNLKITFGKHNGETIGEIEGKDYKYLEWLFDNTKDENIKKAVSILTGLADITPEETKKEINAMPIQETQKQRIKDKYSADEIKDILIKLNKSKLSDLTYEDAEKLLEVK
jgi:hypothetical protein